MTVTRIPLSVIEPTIWSGGQTWQHMLLPADGSYAPDDSGIRHFDLRLSTASVETESSNFTPLPGIDRWLMVDQPIELTINGKTVPLPANKILQFSGDDEVSSRGQTRDLNVMVRRDSGLRAEVSVDSGAVHGPAMVVEIKSRELIRLGADDKVTVGPSLVVRLS